MLDTHDEHDVINNVIVVDIDSPEKWFHYKCDTFPTITATRGAMRGGWIVACGKGRQVTIVDLLKLQGFRPNSISYQAAGISDARIGHVCGNAMSCNVLRALLPQVLKAIGVSPTCKIM